MTSQDYIQEIDDYFYSAKRKKLSRLSDEWGKWSREMNLRLRKLIEEENNEVSYKYVFIYWINRSQLLDAYFKGKLKNMKKIASLKREAKKLLKAVKLGNDPDSLDGAEFKNLAMIALSGMKLGREKVKK